jgi:hypothetical protein
LSDNERKEILDLYLAGRGVNFIQKKLKRRHGTIKGSLFKEFGEERVEEEQIIRMKR